MFFYTAQVGKDLSHSYQAAHQLSNNLLNFQISVSVIYMEDEKTFVFCVLFISTTNNTWVTSAVFDYSLIFFLPKTFKIILVSNSMTILFIPFGFLASKDLPVLAFETSAFKHTRWPEARHLYIYNMWLLTIDYAIIEDLT